MCGLLDERVQSPNISLQHRWRPRKESEARTGVWFMCCCCCCCCFSPSLSLSLSLSLSHFSFSSFFDFFLFQSLNYSLIQPTTTSKIKEKTKKIVLLLLLSITVQHGVNTTDFWFGCIGPSNNGPHQDQIFDNLSALCIAGEKYDSALGGLMHPICSIFIK